MSSNNLEVLKNFFNILKGKIHKSNDNKGNENKELIENINDAREEWVLAKKNFQFVDNEEGVDYYAYKIKAYEVKYQALLKEAKERGVQAIENDKDIF